MLGASRRLTWPRVSHSWRHMVAVGCVQLHRTVARRVSGDYELVLASSPCLHEILSPGSCLNSGAANDHGHAAGTQRPENAHRERDRHSAPQSTAVLA
jgi:hypothetical protein